MTSREQRLVFGEVAELYDRLRPRYPAEVADGVARLAGRRGHVVEVGAGTGILTRDLVARGLRVTALEPSAAMARVLRATCPGADVVESNFEDWTGPAAPVDVIAAGQAWHWVGTDTRVDRAAEMLRSGGWLVLAWNSEHVGADLRVAVDAAYRRWTSNNPAWQTAPVPADEASAAELEADRRFEHLAVEHIEWSKVRTRDEYLDLLTTHSPHRMLSDRALAGLLGEIGAAIDAAGGSVHLVGRATLVTAERRAR